MSARGLPGIATLMGLPSLFEKALPLSICLSVRPSV